MIEVFEIDNDFIPIFIVCYLECSLDAILQVYLFIFECLGLDNIKQVFGIEVLFVLIVNV